MALVTAVLVLVLMISRLMAFATEAVEEAASSLKYEGNELVAITSTLLDVVSRAAAVP